MKLLPVKKTLLLSLCLLILLTVAAITILIVGRLLYLDTYKDVIISTVERTLDRRVTYKNGTFSLNNGATFVFTGAAVMEKDGSTEFVSSKRIGIKVALLPLLEKKIVIKEIRLDDPHINLIRFENGKFNFSDFLEGEKKGIPLLIRSIRIINGSATFSDLAISQHGVISSITNLDLFVSRFIRGKTSTFRLSADISQNHSPGKIVLYGTTKLPPADKSLQDTHFDIRLTAKNIDSAHYWDYYSRYVPFRKITGFFDLDTDFQGKITDFSSAGTAKAKGLHFNYPQVFHSVLAPQKFLAKFKMKLTPNDLVVKHLDLDVDNLSVKGSCALKDIHTEDLFISAKAVTNEFQLEKFAKYIPFGVIPKDTSEFIEKHILGGTYKLLGGTLEGRVSQIAHMEKGTNYNVLSINGTVERGLVSFGKDVPEFNNIKGDLALRGKEFVLAGIKGQFGNSPFSLEGRIVDYPLKTPAKYPFSMSMNPDRKEVLWLLDRDGSGKLGFDGSTTLFLSGNGSTSQYFLNGKWDLTAASYKYSDIISKPSGQANRIAFNGSIGREGVNIESLQYALRSLTLDASGMYRTKEKKQLEYSVASNKFLLQDIGSMIPEIGKYQAKGFIKTDIQGKLNLEDKTDNVFNGNIFLSEVSAKPWQNLKNIENLNGKVKISNDTVSSSALSGKLGDSMFSASGTLTHFKNPLIDLTFSSPAMHFPDIGFRSQPMISPVRNLRGSITVKDGNLHIREFSCQYEKSVINAQGAIDNIKKNPELNITVNSPFLVLNDIFTLKKLELQNNARKNPVRFSGKVDLTAKAGNVSEFPFENLKTALLFREGTIELLPTMANISDGTMHAKGQMDFNPAGKPRYGISFRLNNLSAARIQQSFDLKREITGKISMEGELSAVGDNLQELEKSLQGQLKLHCTDGSLRKFAVLSKIFSILNVSQLFKLRLPDMVSGGMPFNRITGTFAIKNGVAVTDDFFIDSEAINISVIGNFDLPGEQLDLTVGVKPLQTVDKIVSHIPIVGWVLTGKNKSLVTAYFEAKGNWDNPHVRAISIKSLAKGVFNIFKRVFQLPAKLITDTGEVITGNPD